MNWFKQVGQEMWGLFVEDGSFAIAIVLWVAATVFVVPLLLPEAWRGPVEFAGFAGVLVENVLRSATRSRKG